MYQFHTRLDLAKNILPKQGIGCEIGVGSGDYAMVLYEHTQPKELYLIDEWRWHPDKDPTVYGWKCKHDQQSYDNYMMLTYEKFKNMKNVYIIKDNSTSITHLFNDNFFDYVYIDASHDFESVYNDLNNVKSKIKPGGFICGHDYNKNFNANKKLEYGVIEAVDQFRKENNLKIDTSILEPKGRSFILYQ
jgi:hypothetical protein